MFGHGNRPTALQEKTIAYPPCVRAFIFSANIDVVVGSSCECAITFFCASLQKPDVLAKRQIWESYMLEDFSPEQDGPALNEFHILVPFLRRSNDKPITGGQIDQACMLAENRAMCAPERPDLFL